MAFSLANQASIDTSLTFRCGKASVINAACSFDFLVPINKLPTVSCVCCSDCTYLGVAKAPLESIWETLISSPALKMCSYLLHILRRSTQALVQSIFLRHLTISCLLASHNRHSDTVTRLQLLQVWAYIQNSQNSYIFEMRFNEFLDEAGTTPKQALHMCQWQSGEPADSLKNLSLFTCINLSRFPCEILRAFSPLHGEATEFGGRRFCFVQVWVLSL